MRNHNVKIVFYLMKDINYIITMISSIENPVSFLYHYCNLFQATIDFTSRTDSNLDVYMLIFSQKNKVITHQQNFPSISSISSLSDEETFSIQKQRKRECFSSFLQRNSFIEEACKQRDSLPIIDYIQWGSSHYSIDYCMNKISLYFSNLIHQPILYFDSEGSPQVQMIQIGLPHSNQVFIFTDKKVIDHFYEFMYPNKSIKKIVWGCKEENDRATRYVSYRLKKKIEINSSSFVDIQEKYNGKGLKRALGEKFKIRLEVINKKDFYNQNWSRPNESQLIYSTIDIVAMKDLYVKLN
jgi:hypothetical protein